MFKYKAIFIGLQWLPIILTDDVEKVAARLNRLSPRPGIFLLLLPPDRRDVFHLINQIDDGHGYLRNPEVIVVPAVKLVIAVAAFVVWRVDIPGPQGSLDVPTLG